MRTAPSSASAEGPCVQDGRLSNSRALKGLYFTTGSTSTAGLALVLFSAGALDVLGLEWWLQGSATTPCLKVTVG